MTHPIQLESISKCYRIFQNPQDRFKQALLDRFQNVLGGKSTGLLYREHWALRDVSFELQAGEAVGILGRNGAGKSTLLQIIAGTLEPTSGSVITNGRITALLELGSGFNPEFTGRENVFLNAQILGMSRDDVLARFDDIAGFADIGDFIDQPVKTYSSGMMMRLAFSVQTAVEPKVLIVDEALSVGDARFQEKCFRKLRKLRDRGTTIIFVSHDVNAVISFCDRAILFDEGMLVHSGIPNNVAKIYLKRMNSERLIEKKATPELQKPKEPNRYGALIIGANSSDMGKTKEDFQFGNKKVEILSVEIFDQNGKQTETLESGKKYRIAQRAVANVNVKGLASGFIIRDKRGVEIFGVTNKTANVDIPEILSGEIFQLSIEIDVWLSAGDYFLQAANASHHGVQYDCRIDALHFTVINTPLLFTTSIVNLNPKLTFEKIRNKVKMIR